MSALAFPLYRDLIGFLARLDLSGLDGPPRRFHLIREQDTTGVSGTGVVAEGLTWPNGQTLLRWLSDTPTITAYEHVRDVEEIHGHDGRTYTEWLDRVPRAELESPAHP